VNTYKSEHHSTAKAGEDLSKNGSRKTKALVEERIDLAAVYDEGIAPPEELVDGILIAGFVHMFWGKSGSGKTWILLWLVKQLLDRGKGVAYFDSENGKRLILQRLIDLGVDKSKLPNLLYFAFPNLGFGQEDVRRYVEFLDTEKPDFAVFDAVANYLGLSSLEESSNDDFIKWCTRYTRPARERNIAVGLIDHAGWVANHVRGASRKVDEVDVSWEVKCPMPFDRDTTSNVTLRREKDRESWLPQLVRFNIGGTDENGRITCKRTDGEVIEVAGDDGLTRKDRASLDALREDYGPKGATYGQWRAAAERRGVSTTSFKRAKSKLAVEGPNAVFVRKEGDRYFPLGEPDGSKNEWTQKNSLDKAKSNRGQVGPKGVHGPSGPGADGDGSIGSTTLEGGPNGPSAGPDPVSTAGGIVDGENRHGGVEPESVARNGSEGSEIGEFNPDNPSPSPASDAAASQSAPTLVPDGNVALSEGGRLTEAEVKRFRHFRRKGLDGGTARARVLAERRA
jgi:hypothetical protein